MLFRSIISQLFYLNKEDIKSNYVKLTKHLKNIYNKYNTTDNTSNTSYNKIYFKIKQKYDKPSFLENFTVAKLNFYFALQVFPLD